MEEEKPVFDNFGEKLILVVAGGLISLYIGKKYQSFDNIFDLFNQQPLIDILGTSFLIILFLLILLQLLRFLGPIITDIFNILIMDTFVAPIYRLFLYIEDSILKISSKSIQKFIIWRRSQNDDKDHTAPGIIMGAYESHRQIINFVTSILSVMLAFTYITNIKSFLGPRGWIILVIIIFYAVIYHLFRIDEP